jgi:lipopolysaccharide export system permease protein
LTAIRAAGVSLLRLSVPYLATGFVLSAGVFALNELWVPKSLEAAEEIMARRQPGRSNPGKRQWEQQLGFYNPQEQRWWLIASYNMATAEMIKPHITWLRPDGSRLEILAEGGGRFDGVWTFTNANILEYPAERGAIPEHREEDVVPMPMFGETPDQIRSEIRMNKLTNFKSVRKAQLSVREILEYQRLHPGVTSKREMLDTKLHGRLAAPWACLVVVLIALPFGVATGRRNVVVGVASSIVICFVYFVFQQLALALGTGGYVKPWMAAWAPNAFFAIAGLLLIWRVR